MPTAELLQSLLRCLLFLLLGLYAHTVHAMESSRPGWCYQHAFAAIPLFLQVARSRQELQCWLSLLADVTPPAIDKCLQWPDARYCIEI